MEVKIQSEHLKRLTDKLDKTYDYLENVWDYLVLDVKGEKLLANAMDSLIQIQKEIEMLIDASDQRE